MMLTEKEMILMLVAGVLIVVSAEVIIHVLIG